MDHNKEKLTDELLSRLADESGLAVSLVNGASHEVRIWNNNSICQSLNPNGDFCTDCAAYCGKAYKWATEKKVGIAYECHAGLQCIAAPLSSSVPPLVAIVGRAFTKAEKYRQTTEKAITGEWNRFPSSQFFENILLTDPDRGQIERTVQVVARADRLAARSSSNPQKTAPPVPPTHQTATTHSEPEDENREWRSFHASLLRKDFRSGANDILAFLAEHYGLRSMLFLERREETFETLIGHGDMQGKRIRLSVAANDARLIEAVKTGMPLELGERSRDQHPRSRSLLLFPFGFDTDVSSAIAVMDELTEDQKREIAQICHTLSPQVEILRLRYEVARRERLGSAVRRMGESVRSADSDEMWVAITQTAAEMLEAERASLMVFDPELDDLELKALVGGVLKPQPEGTEPGRVAEAVFSTATPVIVPDITRTEIPPAPRQRGYRTPSFMSCPITLGGRNLAVMNFTDRVDRQPFDRSSLELFQAIVPQLAIAIDRASLKAQAGAFEQLSVTDSLTGLLNRRYIEARLSEEIKRSNRHGFPMSFMMLDVDKFKTYNDQFGHPAGDEALKLVGRVIQGTLRGADVAARMGGEEFAILLPQTTAEEAVAIAERIRHNIEKTRFPNRQVTASVGVASCTAELCISADLISAADQALYEAKRRGRNRVLSFETFALEQAQ